MSLYLLDLSVVPDQDLGILLQVDRQLLLQLRQQVGHLLEDLSIRWEHRSRYVREGSDRWRQGQHRDSTDASRFMSQRHDAVGSKQVSIASPMPR